ARERAALDPRARRAVASSRVHEILARAARRVAVERDAEPAAGSHRNSTLVPVQHLQLRELGAHDADAARGVVCATRGEAGAARPATRRAVPRGPGEDGLPTAAAGLVALVAAPVSLHRPRAAFLSKDRPHAISRYRNQRVRGLDRAPPGRGR